MEITKLSLKELQSLDDQIGKEIMRKEKQQREAAIQQIYSIAHGIGLPLKELVNGGNGKRKPTSPPTITYRDPSNPTRSWMGRGPRPSWVKEALAAGKTLDQLRA